MSEFKVPYTTILAINEHPNAERLSVATLYGFQIVVRKDQYKVGDKVVLIPVDSIIPEWLETKLFGKDAKIKLYRRRVRQIRIRGFPSSGMVVDTKDLADKLNFEYISLETDLKEMLEVVKYEPPEPGPAQTVGGPRNRNKKTDNPGFHKYNGLENVKWFPNLFQDGEEVVIQEKLHGTNARAGLLPYAPTTLWKKLLKFVRLAPKYEKCYGSNNVEISARMTYSGWYGDDVYGATFKKIGVFDKLRPGETVFGEIIGPGIQKNYDYGLSEHRFVLFDVKLLLEDGKQKWLTPEEVEAFAKERGFEFVPVLYKGPYNKIFAEGLTKGPSAYSEIQKVREGVVLKARHEYDQEGNKKALKWISELYLDDKDNTDFH